MAKAPAGPARLYVTTRTDTPFQVVYTDPMQREKSGRAKRIAKWFANRKDADDFQADLNKQLVTEGTAQHLPKPFLHRGLLFYPTSAPIPSAQHEVLPAHSP